MWPLLKENEHKLNSEAAERTTRTKLLARVHNLPVGLGMSFSDVSVVGPCVIVMFAFNF